MNSEPAKQHQIDGVKWWSEVKRGLLADEPGLGKSRQAIEGSEGRTLVVAPAMVLAGGTWFEEDDENPGEIQKWADDPERFTTAAYTSLNPREKTGTNASATRPVPHKVKPEYLGPWDTVILDESHYIKGRDTAWTKAVLKITKNVEKVLPMTGTAIPNWAYEAFTTLQVLHPEEVKPKGEFNAYWRWAGNWFDTSPTMWSQGRPSVGDLLGCQRAGGGCEERPVWDPCQHWIDFMHANFGRQWMRRLRDDCLDLPPLWEQTVETPMTGEHKTIYNRMKRDYLTQVDGKEIVSWSSGSRNVALDKITISPWLLNPIGEPRGGKFDRLKWDLQSRSRPTFVVAHYQDVVEASCRVAEALGLRAGYVHGGTSPKAAGEAIRAFKRGTLDVLVGSLEKVAEGLTLVQPDMVIFVEKSYKTYRNQQAVQRVHRWGQTRPVTALDYVTPNSVDSHKRVRLGHKTDHQIRAMTAADFASLL